MSISLELFRLQNSILAQHNAPLFPVLLLRFFSLIRV